MDALWSVANNKYAEGYPNNRYYGGCKIENYTIEKGATNSSIRANMVVMQSVL